MQRKYSVVYSKLVQGDADLIGHIAYSLYKKEKCEYIESKFKHGIELTDEDLVYFNDINSSQSNIDRYKVHAEVILQDFLSELISDQIKSAEEERNVNHIQTLKSITKEIIPKFWPTVWQGVLSGAIFAVILSALGFLLEYNGAFIRFTIEKPLKQTTSTTEVKDSLKNNK